MILNSYKTKTEEQNDKKVDIRTTKSPLEFSIILKYINTSPVVREYKFS